MEGAALGLRQTRILESPSSPASHWPTMSCIRVILLGASNLQLGMPLLLENLQRLLPQRADRLEIWTAAGHGRSYGRWCNVLFRELPGIVPCGLWEDLRKAPVVPDQTFGLVTDIGNDIPFHVPPSEIAGWVSEVLKHLQEQKARIVVTGLPMGPVRALAPWKYRMMRNIFFPASRLSHSEVCDRMDEVNGRVQELAANCGALRVEPESEWYGFDPIHPRPSSRPAAWTKMLSGWDLFPAGNPLVSAGRLAAHRVRILRPQERRLFGRTQIAAQPVFVHENRLHISVY